MIFSHQDAPPPSLSVGRSGCSRAQPLPACPGSRLPVGGATFLPAILCWARERGPSLPWGLEPGQLAQRTEAPDYHCTHQRKWETWGALPSVQALQGSLLKEPAFPWPVLVLPELGTVFWEPRSSPRGPRAPSLASVCRGRLPGGHQVGPGPRGPALVQRGRKELAKRLWQVLGASHSPSLNEDRSPIERLEEMTHDSSPCSQVTSAAPSCPCSCPGGRAAGSQLSQEGPDLDAWADTPSCWR